MNLIGQVVLVVVNLFAYESDGVTVEQIGSMDECKQAVKMIAFNAFDRGDEVVKAKDNTSVQVNFQWTYTCEEIQPKYKG